MIPHVVDGADAPSADGATFDEHEAVVMAIRGEP